MDAYKIDQRRLARRRARGLQCNRNACIINRAALKCGVLLICGFNPAVEQLEGVDREKRGLKYMRLSKTLLKTFVTEQRGVRVTKAHRTFNQTGF